MCPFKHNSCRLESLQFYKKGKPSEMFFVKFMKFYRIWFLQKAAGRLLPIYSFISDILRKFKTSLDKLLALSATNQLNHSWMSVWDLHKDLFATNSQCLSPKYLNNQGRRKHFFVADFDGTNEKRYLTEAVTQRYFTKAEFWNIW